MNVRKPAADETRLLSYFFCGVYSSFPFDTSIVGYIYYANKKYAKIRAPSPSSLEILPPSDSELRPRRNSGVHLAYTDPSGEQQRAPSMPQKWGPPSLHRSFRRATASTVHAAVGSVSLIKILPASDRELRSHMFLGEPTFLFQ